jgi:pimeloyl-ACP methyl ester carboxylesterase
MSTTKIPFMQYGSTGQSLLFLHANGYPPACYYPFFSFLEKTNRIIAMLQRPLWEGSRPDDIKDWIPFTGDLLRFLEENPSLTPIRVVGHSMGGIATLRAALRQPGRFRSIVLLDPVLLPPYFIIIWNIALGLNFAHRLHPHIATTLKRRREFDDLERVFKSYRRRPTFKYMDDDSLRAYIDGITYPMKNGRYRLRQSPEWESRIYYASIWHDLDIWRELPKLKVPTLIVRGTQTDTFWERTGKLVQRKQPKVRVEALEYSTHLLPLERPGEVADLIQSFFEENP